jgi:hypothetical protein
LDIQDESQDFVDIFSDYLVLHGGIFHQQLENFHEERLELLTGVVHEVKQDFENDRVEFFSK